MYPCYRLYPLGIILIFCYNEHPAMNILTQASGVHMLEFLYSTSVTADYAWTLLVDNSKRFIPFICLCDFSFLYSRDPWAKSSLLPVFTNESLLELSHRFMTYYLWWLLWILGTAVVPRELMRLESLKYFLSSPLQKQVPMPTLYLCKQLIFLTFKIFATLVHMKFLIVA